MATVKTKQKPSSNTAPAAGAGAAGGVNPGTNSPVPDVAMPGGVVTQPEATPPAAEPSSSGATTTAESAPAVSPAGEAEPKADGATESQPDLPPVVARVRSMQARGFWRVGRYWPAEVTEVRFGDLTAEQIEVLRAEPKLKVEDVA